jgi:hypothetical protein
MGSILLYARTKWSSIATVQGVSKKVMEYRVHSGEFAGPFVDRCRADLFNDLLP